MALQKTVLGNTLEKTKQTPKAVNTSCSNGNLIRYKEKILHLESGLALEQVPKEFGEYLSEEIFQNLPGQIPEQPDVTSKLAVP